MPVQPRRSCPRVLQPPEVEQPIIVSSDTSADSLPPLEPRQPAIMDLDSSAEDLPDIDPRPEFPRLLQHQVLREAYVLLERLQEPQQQPKRPPTPPVEPEVDCAGLEDPLAEFDAPQPIYVQQVVLPPLPFKHPQPPPPVDWAMVAYALFTIAEREHQQRLNNLI